MLSPPQPYVIPLMWAACISRHIYPSSRQYPSWKMMCRQQVRGGRSALAFTAQHGKLLGKPDSSFWRQDQWVRILLQLPLIPAFETPVAVICLSRVKLTSQTGFLPAEDKKVTVLFSIFFCLQLVDLFRFLLACTVSWRILINFIPLDSSYLILYFFLIFSSPFPYSLLSISTNAISTFSQQMWVYE